ncbi:hypothetical protein [Pseudoalteromonas sp. T1lg88]|uniref:hypothetical protein n=1 Tax=Pseudoalteromonas sp. T1lg88 TaxID=2077104 RepID=UPI000CF60A45|nr:hypothetical protein [Pseudoalteromonas sp. T1lg88]
MSSKKAVRYSAFVNFHRKVAKLMLVDFRRHESDDSLHSLYLFLYLLSCYFLVCFSDFFYDFSHDFIYEYIPSSKFHYEFSLSLGEEVFVSFVMSVFTSFALFFHYFFRGFTRAFYHGFYNLLSIFKYYLSLIILFVFVFYSFCFFYVNPGVFLSYDDLGTKGARIIISSYENRIVMLFWFSFFIGYGFPVLAGVLFNQLLRFFYISLLIIWRKCYGS